MTFLAILTRNGAPAGEAGPVPAVIRGAHPTPILLGRHRQVALYTTNSACDQLFASRLVSDGRNWFLGRVRLDARDELLDALQSSAGEVRGETSDAGFCLAAYRQWGRSSLERLRGDFSFVIWDEAAQSLLCARDHLGVRPLFWTETASAVAVSDKLDALASLSGADRSLDDTWMSAFFMPRLDPGLERTIYASIRRVPPAHALELTQSDTRLSRYWSLELGAPVFHSDPRRYVEEFDERLSCAVKDRMPEGRVGLTMSGGLDSSTLAAKAVEVADPSRVLALTHVFRSLIFDDEEHFSGLVVRRLGIAHTIVPTDGIVYDTDWKSIAETPPEPWTGIWCQRLHAPIAASMAEQAPVWLYGEGPDNALTFEWRPYFRWLKQNRAWSRLAGAALSLVATTPLAEWRTAIVRLARRGRPWVDTPLPEPVKWLDDGFARQTEIQARTQEWHRSILEAHPWRPLAMSSFASSIWPDTLERMDVSVSGVPIEWRHPYLDLRVLSFLLAVPPLPWSRAKRIVRAAMRGRLPDEVLARPKTPLRSDPLVLMLRECGLPDLEPRSPVARYCKPAALSAQWAQNGDPYPLLNAHVLDHWLTRRGYV